MNTNLALQWGITGALVCAAVSMVALTGRRPGLARVHSAADRRPIPFIALVPFLLVTFGWAWGILGLFIVQPVRMTALVGELTGRHPLFLLAVYAPAIAALGLVARHDGAGGVRRFLARLLVWRCSAPWYAFLVAGIPLLFIAGSAVKGNLLTGSFPFSSLQSLFVALVFAAITGPVEELGWRGVALPLLQRKVAPLWAGLILGVIWGCWHLPAFVLSGTPQVAWSFTPFLAGSIAMSVMMTALFNRSRGSILLPAMFHFQANNPVWPDAQPYDTWFFVAAAVLVVWLNREAMLTRAGAVTALYLPGVKSGGSACPGSASGPV